MRLILITLLMSVSLTALSQRSVLQTQLIDNSQTLSIRINGNVDGRKIQYNQTFDVAYMNDLQKDLLKYRVFESQGVSLPLHEMTRLILAVLTGLVLIITLGIVSYRIRKPRHSTS
ncbi:hypothetical protein DYU11_06110 [Fibrisoma montanum]|uniref:Uncharacterized protein n=1 Tax=Fibrisoma montanum TaxID=2305895 RepID=A0A418MDJ6_9BACT|nr:hypothetical protein [Fibrisoma montanum]RIV24890.1 hypothetical protein DYU11_06110 [Fibrisoma montanum]